MSLQFWSMKLSNTLVYHKGAYKEIIELDYDRTRMEKDKVKDFKFPEDSVKYVRFHLSGGTVAKYDDFEIKFPEDSYTILHNKAVFGKRKMTRGFKLAPSQGSIDLPENITAKQYLNSLDKFKFNDPATIWEFPKDDQVYSNMCALVKDRTYTKRLLFGQTIVGILKRHSDHIILTSRFEQKHLPSFIVDNFYHRLGEKIPAPSIKKTEDEDDDFPLLNNKWKRESKPFLKPRTMIESNCFYVSDEGWMQFAINKNVYTVRTSSSEKYIRRPRIRIDITVDTRRLFEHFITNKRKGS